MFTFGNNQNIRLMGQDKFSFFSESHVTVPGDDLHGFAVRVPARLVMIVKGTEFYLKRDATALCVYKQKRKQ